MQRLLLALLATFCLSPALHAEAAPSALQFLQIEEVEYFAPDESGRAPKDIVFAMVITTGDFANFPAMSFTIWTEYQPDERDAEPGGGPKSVLKVTLDRLRGDQVTRIGKFTAKKRAATWEGVYGKSKLDVQLLPGDVILWSLKNKKLPLIEGFDQFEITAGIVTSDWVFKSSASGVEIVPTRERRPARGADR